MTPLSIEETFQFSCSKRVSCYNECCRDLNQFLTPYDILRLKQRLGLPSYIFLDRYTSQHVGPETGLLVVTLKSDHSQHFKCPFVTPAGCRVYKDRPASCRTYPLVRMASRARETGKISEQYFILKEPHCLGFNQGQAQTVQQWVKDQGVVVYNQMNDLLMEIIGLKNRRLTGQLDIHSKFLFNMACYDLDTFKTHIFDKGILNDYNMGPNALDKAKQDDVELLKLGFNWIKDTLFNNGT